MKYKSEVDMYSDVCQWLEDFLRDRFRQADIDVYDLSRTPISRFLGTYNQGIFPEEWVTWNIRVDVVGFVHHSNKPTDLVFVECKNVRLTVAHLSQLLGYSRVARPLYSFLLSPVGFSSSLVSLLQDYRRLDVLEYHSEQGRMPRQIIIAKWDIAARHLNRNAMIGGASL